MNRRVRITFVDGTPRIEIEAQPGHDYRDLSSQLDRFQLTDELHVTAIDHPMTDATATIDWAPDERISILFSKLCFVLLHECRARSIL